MDRQFLKELRKLIKSHYPDYKWSEIKVTAPHFSFEAKEMYSDQEDEYERPTNRPTIGAL